MSHHINITHQAFSLPIVEIKSKNLSKVVKSLHAQVAFDSESSATFPCVINLQGLEISPTFLAQCVELLRQVNLQVIGVQTEDLELAEQANFAGLSVFDKNFYQDDQNNFYQAPAVTINNDMQSDGMNVGDTRQEFANELNLAEIPQSLSNNLKVNVHQGHVHDGEQVYAENADLVVLGDVKPGGEVVADGSIYIGGRLQGKAYAGNSGTMNADQASIRSYVFEPELVSISGFYQLQDDMAKKYLGLAIKVVFEKQQLHYTLD